MFHPVFPTNELLTHAVLPSNPQQTFGMGKKSADGFKKQTKHVLKQALCLLRRLFTRGQDSHFVIIWMW